MSLEIRDLSLRFGGLIALNRVSLDADDGELVAIVGPNGAGKTALLNCINGVYRPAAGHIALDGRDIAQVPVDKIALARVGRAFQHAELFPPHDCDGKPTYRPSYANAYRPFLRRVIRPGPA